MESKKDSNPESTDSSRADRYWPGDSITVNLPGDQEQQEERTAESDPIEGNNDASDSLDDESVGGSLFRLISHERDEIDKKYETQVSQPDYIDRLKEAADSLLQPTENFDVGDLVKWKKHLRNTTMPHYDSPAVVVGLEPGRISATKDPASPKFAQPVDLVLGVIDGDGDFFLYSFDHRRFTRWES